MRNDGYPFSVQNAASTKEPRFVIKIEFETDSVYMTSHDDIQGVPGTVLYGVLKAPSALSQKIVPDEGRSEIGAMSFSLIDYNSEFTTEIAQRLQDGHGMRGRKVKLWIGYRQTTNATGYGAGGYGEGEYGIGGTTAGDPIFSDFQLFQTQIVKNCGFDKGVYNVRCSDITREQRATIFDPKITTLRDSITDASTTIPVYSTLGFHPISHGTAYSDAPSTVVGYFKLGDEIIRYTGLTDDSFTGCTRGVLNSKAVAVTVNANTEQDNRPKVTEYVYLEMPAVKLVYAILTGVIWGTAYTLPTHWHLGIDPDLITDADFTGIGLDLWDTTDDTAGFVVRFLGLGKTDGKKFIESELLMLLACYQPVYNDGSTGLRRMTQVLADAAYCMLLNEDNVVDAGELLHDMDGMYNQLQINWNYNGQDYTRRTVFIDSISVAAHGAVPLKTLSFKGLQGSRHTTAILKQRIAAFRDRYTSPPETIQVTVMPSLSKLEVGDIVRLQLDSVRDFAGDTVTINRSFEIQQKSEDYASGNVTLSLFGSTAAANDETAPPSDTGAAVLPDAYYDSAGTELSTVVTINVVGGVGVVAAGTYNLTGNADLNAAGAIYYYLGDLTIPDGVTFTGTQNVQIRVRGFLTFDGDYNGDGNGLAGQADSGVVNINSAGLAGYFGTTRGMNGVREEQRSPRFGPTYSSTQCLTTAGLHSVAPLLSLAVEGDELLGIPADIRGTAGGSGGQITSFGIGETSDTLRANGGAGGNGGAGLVLIARGMTFGASALINLSGDDTATPTPYQLGILMQPGAGAVGCPGCLYILIDGNDNFFPDIGGHFLGKTGVSGAPLQNFLGSPGTGPKEGLLDAGFISNVDYSNVAYRIQYIPGEEVAQEDEITAPGALTVNAVVGGNLLSWQSDNQILSQGAIPVYQIYASVDNDRTNSTLVAETTSTYYLHGLNNQIGYYYWVRKRIAGQFSGWHPESSTAGIASNANQAIDVVAVSASGVAVTTKKGTPDNYSKNTTIATLTYIAPYNARIKVTATAQISMESGSGPGLYFYHSMQHYSVTNNGITSYPAFDTTKQREYFQSDVAAGTEVHVQSAISDSALATLFAGETHVFRYCATAFWTGDVMTIDYVDFRLEATPDPETYTA